jgi:hypothetical protein
MHFGITKHAIGPFRLKNPGAVSTDFAYVTGTALGREFSDAPGPARHHEGQQRRDGELMLPGQLML